MPFPVTVREDALVRASRCCCVCHTFGGRNIVAHHIIQEADGGPNTIDNAIPLCPMCHMEAGHYNKRHPLGTKYSPTELRRHRDKWFSVCQAEATISASLRDQTSAFPPRCVEFEVIEREIGILWSHLANKPECREIVRFRGTVVGEYRCEDASGPHWWKLIQVRGGRFLVYHKHIHCGDYCQAAVLGAWGEMDQPLSLGEVHDKYPEVATAAGLERVRVLEM